MNIYDPKFICPKCGCKQCDTRYVATRDLTSWLSAYQRGPKEEHIAQTCERCRYTTYSRPLDSEVTE